MDFDFIGPAAPYLATALFTLAVSLGAMWVDRKWRHQREDDLAIRHQQEWSRQQWWFRKLDAYTALLNALWVLKESTLDEIAFYDARYSGEARTPLELPGTREAMLLQIRRTAQVDHFALPQRVVATVHQMQRRWDQLELERERLNAEPEDAASNQYQLVQATVDEILKIAQSDLGIPDLPAMNSRTT